MRWSSSGRFLGVQGGKFHRRHPLDSGNDRNERRPPLEISAESRKDPGDRIQILQAAEFDGGVHISNRKAYEAAGDPTIPKEDGIRVGAGASWSRGSLNRDLFRGRSGEKPLDHDRLGGAAHRDLWSARHLEVAVSIAIDARGVGRMTDVGHECDVRLESVRDHRRAVQADFFLDGTDRYHVAVQFLAIVGEHPECFRGSPSADSIVESSSENHVVAEHHRAVREDAGIADIQSFGSLLLRLTTDVDEEFVELTDLRIAAAVLKMNGRRADHPSHGLVDTLNARDKTNPLSNDRSWIDTADLAAVDEALVVDIVDHQADFVGMAADRHGGNVISTAFEAGEAVPVGIIPGRGG